MSISCSTNVQLNASDHARILKEVDTNREFGGNFALRSHNGTRQLYIEKGGYGTLDTVDISRNIVEFHTHPRKCVDDDCALGVPSPPDITNILIGSAFGTQYHVLYSSDGVFVISVPKSIQAELSDERSFLRFVKRFIPRLYKVFNEHVKGRLSYAKFRDRYMRVIHEMGISIHKTATNVAPELNLEHPCSLPDSYSRKVFVPDWYDRSMKGVLM
jgi:hypothetical protein